MREPTDADAETWVLTTDEGRELLDDVSSNRRPLPADLERWRKQAAPNLVSAALRLADVRVRARMKFSRAERMWLQAVGLEQATAETVARHKARRFGGGRVADLCSGIGGDTLALAADAKVCAVDADHDMCRRTRWNADVYDVGTQVEVVCARAERFAVPSEWLVHVDPDRRARSAGRARDLEAYVPGLDFLHNLIANSLGGAIKLGPASNFSAHFGSLNCEIELISLGGECKEATIWFGDLATCHRRATRLPDGPTWTDQDGPADDLIPVMEPSTWVYDPDPALGRSGLLPAFARAHGLARCGPGIDFLTSPLHVRSPFLVAFEVESVHPLDMKTLRRLVAGRRLGPLEIKTKGLDRAVESIRKDLRPEGSFPASLLLMGGEGPARAIVAHRVS